MTFLKANEARLVKIETRLQRIQECLNGSAETAGASYSFKELGAQVEKNGELNEGARGDK